MLSLKLHKQNKILEKYLVNLSLNLEKNERLKIEFICRSLKRLEVEV